MNATQTALLGAIAGSTIFLGLPVARMRGLTPQWRAFLSVASAGILLFIFWDVMTASIDIVETSLQTAQDNGSWGPFVLRLVMTLGGLALGAVGLGVLEARVLKVPAPAPIAGGSDASPVALDASVDVERRSRALSLGMMIAVAIGLHNLSEGLAIGVSARSGDIALAGTLILGFALHNATEGFGIVGPLGEIRPTWGWIIVAGLIGGGPTFVGTLIGYRVTSEPLELAFFALAGGAILYVVGQIWGPAQRRSSARFVLGALVLGFAVGLLTDLVIAAGGG